MKQIIILKLENYMWKLAAERSYHQTRLLLEYIDSNGIANTLLPDSQRPQKQKKYSQLKFKHFQFPPNPLQSLWRQESPKRNHRQLLPHVWSQHLFKQSQMCPKRKGSMCMSLAHLLRSQWSEDWFWIHQTRPRLTRSHRNRHLLSKIL